MVSFNTKLNKQHVLRYGINLNMIRFNMWDSAVSFIDDQWKHRWQNDEYGVLGQAYLQWKWRPNEKLAMTAGLHSQFFSISQSISPIEPRIGMRYTINNKSAVALYHQQQKRSILRDRAPFANTTLLHVFLPVPKSGWKSESTPQQRYGLYQKFSFCFGIRLCI